VRVPSLSVRVAGVQFGLGKQNYREAVEKAQTLIRMAAEKGAKAVCFPEHWLLEYREHGHLAVEELSSAAHDAKIFVITGANLTPNAIPNSPELRVRSLIIDSEGKRLGQQDKVHLYENEKKVATPGNEFRVFQSAFGRIGILVGYDCMFPEAARTLALKGADLIFVPSRIAVDALDAWMLYLRTRALENRIPVVAANVFGPPRYVGGTAIIELIPQSRGHAVLPKVIASAGSGEKIVLADVNVERARDLRRERFLDRKPTTYFGH
jgi:predicted amidohydrolase